MTAPQTTTEVLVKARQILKDQGWVQGDFVDQDSGCKLCAEGAVYVACGSGIVNDPTDGWTLDFEGNSPLAQDSINVLRGQLQDRPAYLQHVPRFNDAPDTTYEDVDALFASAIEAAG